MSDDDLLTSLVSGDPQSSERVKAIVSQLRSRGQLSQLAQLSGDPTLMSLGQHMQSQDQSNEVELGRNAMQNRSDDIRDTAQARLLKHGEDVLAEEKRWHDMEHEDKLAKMAQTEVTPDMQNTIQGILKHDIPLPTMSRSPKNLAIIEAVMTADPNYDATKYQAKQKAQKDFATGPQGNMVRFAQTGVGHLDLADQKADLMHNSTIPAWNFAKNLIGPAIGMTDVAKGVAGLQTAKTILSDEIDKFFINGGGAEKDRQHLQDQLSTASSPPAIHEVTNTLRQMMATQMGNLKDQYESNTGGNFIADKMNPAKHKDVLDALGWNGDAFTGVRPKAPTSALPGVTGALAPPPMGGSGVPPSAAPGGSAAAPSVLSGTMAGMQTQDENGAPITPYNRAGLVQALRPDRPAPVTETTEVPGVTIVKKKVNSKGELWALMSDGSEKLIERQTFR